MSRRLEATAPQRRAQRSRTTDDGAARRDTPAMTDVALASAAEPSGTFAVSLQTISWTRRPIDSDEAAAELGSGHADAQVTTVWALVQVEQVSGQSLERIWFSADDEVVMTKCVELSSGAGLEPEDAVRRLEYVQSSRPVPLSTDSLAMLMNAQLKITLYCGSSRSRSIDTSWGEHRVAFLPAIVGERLRQRVHVRGGPANSDEIAVDLSIQCDVDLADFALGARVLRVHSLRIVNPPKEWTLQCESDDDAVKLCAASESNVALYDLELQLPECSAGGTSTHLDTETVKFSGGKLCYAPSATASAVRATDGVDAADPKPLSGAWSIAFPGTTANKLYTKAAVERLVDFIQVEKTVPVTLRRTNVEAAGRVSTSMQLRVSDLVSPGATRVHAEAPVKKLLPLPREALEQELTAATTNDEKKRLQALLNDYESIALAATALSGAVRSAKTRVECVFDVVSTPLVVEPPPTLRPTTSISELVPPRDLSDEYEARKDVVRDLRSEIRRVVLTVLHEYEDAIAVTNPAATREETRQLVVFKLNTQGIYHEFKEKLKKRVVPIIRDQFAKLDLDHDEIAAVEGSGESGDSSRGAIVDATQSFGGKRLSRADAKKKQYFAQLYAMLMDEVHRALHETFYATTTALEKTHADLQARDEAKVTATLTALWLKALENDVNGDADKSEALHLDRIAFAEERAVDIPAASPALSPSLGSVWYDYAAFCLGQGELDKAGGALRQCLSLEPRALPPLLAYGALLCEEQDFTGAETVLKNAVSEALHVAARDDDEGALAHLVMAHAMLAFFFTRSGGDVTGNLARFELLKAQHAIRRVYERREREQLQQLGTSTDPDGEPSRSSVWIFLADKAHELRLRGVTQIALELADQQRRARDLLTREERVLKRVVHAELLSLRGEGDRAALLLQEALSIDPAHPFAWLVLGQTNLQLESQSQAAIDCLQRALEHKQRLARPERRLRLFVYLGLAQLQAAKFDAAKNTFVAASEEFAVASTWLGAGIASLRLDQADDAEIALAEANRLDATNPEVWGYMALHALTAVPRVTLQHEQNAKRCIAQALRHQLSNPALLREVSSAFIAIDRLEEAEKLLRRALVYQDSSLTRKTLADVLAAQNCAEDALAQYKQSLDETLDLGERSVLLDKCAALLVTLGRPDEADECRQMASQLLDPPSPQRHVEVVVDDIVG